VQKLFTKKSHYPSILKQEEVKSGWRHPFTVLSLKKGGTLNCMHRVKSNTYQVACSQHEKQHKESWIKSAKCWREQLLLCGLNSQHRTGRVKQEKLSKRPWNDKES